MVTGDADAHLVNHRSNATLMEVDTIVRRENGLVKQTMGDPLAEGALCPAGETAVKFLAVDRVGRLARRKGESVDQRHGNHAAVKRLPLQRAQEPLDDGDPVQFIAVADRLDVDDGSRLSPAEEHHRHAERQPVGRLADVEEPGDPFSGSSEEGVDLEGVVF